MKKQIILAALLLASLLFLASCKNEGDIEKVVMTTSDGVGIVGNFYHTNSNRAVILLHMLNSNKESWDGFALELRDNNFNVLAIDLRGHGSSNVQNGMILSWRRFGDDEFMSMVLDVEAAVKFLEDRGIKREKIVIGGASIGANTALNAGSAIPGIHAVFLLSPGRDYKGINIEEAVETIDIPVFIMASEMDDYSFESSKFIREIIGKRGVKTSFIYYSDSAAHGTDILVQGKESSPEILHWLDTLEI